MSKIKTAWFEVTGDMQVKGRPIRDVKGNICGYKQKDGSIVKLMVALEIQDKTGSKFHCLTTDTDMWKIGFDLLDYDQAKFVE
jgi:hypothetical protein